MPDKIDSGQFYIQHSLYDMVGPETYDVLPPPPLPALLPFGDDPGFPPSAEPDKPKPLDPLVGQLYWDFDLEDFFAFTGGDPSLDSNWSELHFPKVYWDFDTLVLYGWNPADEAYEAIPLDTLPAWFVLTTDDPSAGSNSVNVSAAGGVLTLILSDLPTSDPGGGAVWLSPT